MQTKRSETILWSERGQCSQKSHRNNPMSSPSAQQLLPPPAVASLAGYSHVVPGFGAPPVAGTPGTTFSDEFPPSSPISDAAMASVGKSTVIAEISPELPIPPSVRMSTVTEVSPEPPMPQVLVPSSPVNAIPEAPTALVAKSTETTKVSPEPPMTSLSQQGLDQVLPPPAVASFTGYSPVVPATSVQGIAPTAAPPLAEISITTISGKEFPPIPPSSPTALVGESTAITEISPELPIPPVPAPSSPVNAILDAGRMWRSMRELIRTAILDPALINFGNMLFNALEDGDREKACCIVFMAAILLFVRNYVI